MARLTGSLSPHADSFRQLFHRTLRPCVLALAVGLLSLSSYAQQPKVMAPHRPVPPRITPHADWPQPAPVSRSMVGGLWMIDANFKSAI
jgi:hypothetical protein